MFLPASKPRRGEMLIAASNERILLSSVGAARFCLAVRIALDIINHPAHPCEHRDSAKRPHETLDEVDGGLMVFAS